MIGVRHAGDLGDIIYFLPVLRTLCRGDKAAFLIEAAPYTRQLLTPDKWCGIDELLMRQPYIADVRQWRKGEPVNYNGNDFRARLHQSLRVGIGKDKHLTHWMAEAHGVNPNVLLEQWLTIDDPIEAAPVVFARAGAGRPAHQCYHGPEFPWHLVWKKYGKDAVFVGTGHEHDIFCATCGEVPHFETKTLLEAARVIAGCKLFVGNQTATLAIADGLKKNIVVEVWPGGPNACPVRPGATLGWDRYVKLPDL